ncbi:hypothetical protein D9758_003429 [Tetrapyrgos nigripes]|uniref:Uncharacterized protein n=1 Tax=Tetrapyrgos nigripes TaxID=182062 RepID=A0A8H5LW58_9AGAR|nr:hypothetical protein D9758_003429 [Tetrapyrgos nigripes]
MVADVFTYSLSFLLITGFMSHPSRFISFSTQRSRDLVRRILAPHPKLGLRAPDIFAQIHGQFPDAKESEKYLPNIHPDAAAQWKALGMYPEHPEHPVRSMKHLKRNILPEMLERGIIHEVFINRKNHKDTARFKYNPPTKTVYEILPEPVIPKGVDMEFRWRLIPPELVTDKGPEAPDPDPEKVREERERLNRQTMERQKRKIEAKFERRLRKKAERAAKRGF